MKIMFPYDPAQEIRKELKGHAIESDIERIASELHDSRKLDFVFEIKGEDVFCKIYLAGRNKRVGELAPVERSFFNKCLAEIKERMANL